MRSTIYAVIFSTLFWCVGTAEAANDLDGKALLCKDSRLDTDHPFYGLVFEKGKVTRIHVDGYSKVSPYRDKDYNLRGTKEVWWHYVPFREWTISLNRETLKVKGDQCKISSKKEIFQKLDAIISEAKKKNKL